MQISSRILRLSLLSLFAEAVEHGGDSLSLAEISRRWATTGLRGSDLRDAVHELMESGDLSCRQCGEEMRLFLGTDARQGLHHERGELFLATLEQEAAMLHARYRPRPGPPAVAQRRLDDSVN